MRLPARLLGRLRGCRFPAETLSLSRLVFPEVPWPLVCYSACCYPASSRFTFVFANKIRSLNVDQHVSDRERCMKLGSQERIAVQAHATIVLPSVPHCRSDSACTRPLQRLR